LDLRLDKIAVVIGLFNVLGVVLFPGLDAVRRDPEERSAGDGHVAVEPFAIIEFDDFFPKDQFTLWFYYFPFFRSQVNSTPKFIALITFFLA